MRDQIEQSIALAQSRPWRIGPWFAILVFAALLVTPLFVQVLSLDRTVGHENRTLADPINWADIRRPSRLPRRLESYILDHFGFRNSLVHLNSLLRYHFGVSSNAKVVIGSDGWLFYNNDRILEQHMGLDIFSPKELDSWRKRMGEIELWLKRRNIPLIMMVAPDKATIYPEMLPNYPAGQASTSRADQIVSKLADSSLTFIDPRQSIRTEKAHHPRLYFEGDTHWSHRASYIAYGMLMKELKTRFPSISAVSLESYDSTEQPVASDLVSLLGLQYNITIRGEVLVPKGHAIVEPVIRTPAPGAAWGWPIKFYKTDQPDKPRAIIFGDSFTDYILGPTFLYSSLNDPVFTHHNTMTLDYDLIEEVKPDVVMIVIAERYLQIMPGPPPKN